MVSPSILSKILIHFALASSSDWEIIRSFCCFKDQCGEKQIKFWVTYRRPSGITVESCKCKKVDDQAMDYRIKRSDDWKLTNVQVCRLMYNVKVEIDRSKITHSMEFEFCLSGGLKEKLECNIPAVFSVLPENDSWNRVFMSSFSIERELNDDLKYTLLFKYITTNRNDDYRDFEIVEVDGNGNVTGGIVHGTVFHDAYFSAGIVRINLESKLCAVCVDKTGEIFGVKLPENIPSEEDIRLKVAQ